MSLSDQVKGLQNDELKYLRTLINRELRRRKRIEARNHEWTSNAGLEVCLQSSIRILDQTKSNRSEPENK